MIACLAAISCGDRPAAEPSVLGRTYERPSVTGTVRRDGVAVAGARVSLGEGGPSTATDASGAYRFEGVDAGAYRLVVVDGGDDAPLCTADGTCITTQSARHAAVDVVVGDEPVVADIDL